VLPANLLRRSRAASRRHPGAADQVGEHHRHGLHRGHRSPLTLPRPIASRKRAARPGCSSDEPGKRGEAAAWSGFSCTGTGSRGGVPFAAGVDLRPNCHVPAPPAPIAAIAVLGTSRTSVDDVAASEASSRAAADRPSRDVVDADRAVVQRPRVSTLLDRMGTCVGHRKSRHSNTSHEQDEDPTHSDPRSGGSSAPRASSHHTTARTRNRHLSHPSHQTQ
jgi:hypothetical protein